MLGAEQALRLLEAAKRIVSAFRTRSESPIEMSEDKCPAKALWSTCSYSALHEAAYSLFVGAPSPMDDQTHPVMATKAKQRLYAIASTLDPSTVHSPNSPNKMKLLGKSPDDIVRYK